MTSQRSQAVELPTLEWAKWQARFVFFTGKGGVGKTTVAATVAVSLADTGRRVLVVSTDPASNLADMFGAAIGTAPTEIERDGPLWAMNIDPEAATAAYRERVIRPYRGAVAAGELRGIEEQLAGQCTVEIAAFDEFARLLADPQETRGFDHVLFDTAPTGHTLRLLSLPAAWTSFIDANPGGASCLGPLAGLEAKRDEYAATLQALADPTEATVVLVARADRGALAEAARAGDELAALGITHQMLVVNGVLEDPLPGDAIAERFARRQHDALERMPSSLVALPCARVPLVSSDLTGIEALRGLASGAATTTDASTPVGLSAPPTVPGVDDLIADLGEAGRGVVLVMGKGGVGKTSIAIALARGLAQRGYPVHLSTTDPAGNPEDLVGADRPASLTVSRIDPALEVDRYRREKLAAVHDITAEERSLLEEDLRSPCTQEIAVFQAFSRLLQEARDRFVVLDTAPTGHTLLLLDTTGAYHRDTVRLAQEKGMHVTTPLMKLQDATLARVLIVTLPETTPVHEAAELQEDLRRAGIEPYGWVINASLTGSQTRDPVLLRRARLEQRHITTVATQIAARTWLVPWSTDTPL